VTLAALGACAAALAISALFPRPTSLGDQSATAVDADKDDLAALLDREARGVTSGVLWGTRAAGGGTPPAPAATDDAREHR